MRTVYLTTFFFSILLSLAFLLGNSSCTNPSPSSSNYQNGAALAQVHCASCHQYPDPNMLDKKTWKRHVLPRMGYMMGILPIDSIGDGFIEAEAIEKAYSNPQIFRQEATITLQEWNDIRDFYLNQAPGKAIEAPRKQVEYLNQFSIEYPASTFSPPSTTMLRLSGDNLYLGDAHTKRLYQFSPDLRLTNVANLKEGIVDLFETPDQLFFTIMGSFSPTDLPSGMLLSLPKTQGEGVKIILDSLKRPVQSSFGDLNGDDKIDILTCEFGKWTGSLSWWEQTGENQKYQRHVLRDMPGAIRAYIGDMNGDQLPDVIALFGQGEEGIFIYYNQGNGQFKEEQVLRFPPTYGSSYFALYDFNQDGHPDIIHTAGDNADFPPILKAYQGIRIFLNDGENQFSESFFYPMYGAYSAIPADYDQDGDMDIAAISFFPDFQRSPQHSFLYLENKGTEDYQFTPYTFPDAQKGRWIVMDAGDIDKDGDLDILLGALAFEVIPKTGLVDQWRREGIPFVVLKNALK